MQAAGEREASVGALRPRPTARRLQLELQESAEKREAHWRRRAMEEGRDASVGALQLQDNEDAAQAADKRETPAGAARQQNGDGAVEAVDERVASVGVLQLQDDEDARRNPPRSEMPLPAPRDRRTETERKPPTNGTPLSVLCSFRRQ